MSRLSRLLAAATALLVVACSDNNNIPAFVPQPVDPVDPPMENTAAELRVTHASPDAPAVNVYVNGERALSNVDYKQSSGIIFFEEGGELRVEVRGILPDGSETTVIGPADIDLPSGMRTDIVAIDTLFNADGGLQIQPRILDPVMLEDDITDVRVSVLHAAPAVADVDIYVTGPGQALADVTPIDADFGDAAGPVALMPDTNYRVRITPDGDTTVVYDSGDVSFPAGTELLLVAVENTFKTGANPVNLLAVGADGAAEVFDVAQGAEVRVVHNSADTPAVDVWVDGAEVLDAVPFPAASAYDDIMAPAGTYNVVVAADADSSIAPIDEDLTLEAAQSYSVYAIGSFADSSIRPLVTQDHRRSVATAAGVEVVHGSYLVAAEIPVDVYLTADGVIADVDPAISGLAYGETTGQIPVSPGDYWVTVTAAGDKSVVAFDSGGVLTLDAGTNYTVVARDPSAAEAMGMPLILATILAD